MKIFFPLICLAAAALRAQQPAAPATGGNSATLLAYDEKGELLDREKFLALIGRADRGRGRERKIPISLTSPHGLGSETPWLTQSGSTLTLAWDKLARVQISLPWPVKESGFSTVWLDNGGSGFSNGDIISVNEEIALTQYRLFSEALMRHTSGRAPAYRAGGAAAKLAQKARESSFAARLLPPGAKRAAAFDKALRQTAGAWEKMLVEHGRQTAGHSKSKDSLRFGLTLDESLLERLDDQLGIIGLVKDSGSNWVRLVFRSNPDDFTYSRASSFNEYDAFIRALGDAGINIMGGVLDTAQWPSTLTSGAYTQRAKNLALHYRDQIHCWELGSELNGDWLGGSRSPLSTDQVFNIYSEAAANIKDIDPAIEVAATLYWWDGTAPDEDHSLFGWLQRYGPRGFGKNLDVVSLSLQPDDNPVGMAFETIFERVHLALPEAKLMLGSFGFVENKDLNGYWWFDPEDVNGARKDLIALYMPASCAVSSSLCGGFWWHTLDHMLPEKGSVTELYAIYKKALRLLNR